VLLQAFRLLCARMRGAGPGSAVFISNDAAI
jgi:hypothetical protein